MKNSDHHSDQDSNQNLDSDKLSALYQQQASQQSPQTLDDIILAKAALKSQQITANKTPSENIFWSWLTARNSYWQAFASACCVMVLAITLLVPITNPNLSLSPSENKSPVGHNVANNRELADITIASADSRTEYSMIESRADIAPMAASPARAFKAQAKRAAPMAEMSAEAPMLAAAPIQPAAVAPAPVEQTRARAFMAAEQAQQQSYQSRAMKKEQYEIEQRSSDLQQASTVTAINPPMDASDLAAETLHDQVLAKEIITEEQLEQEAFAAAAFSKEKSEQGENTDTTKTQQQRVDAINELLQKDLVDEAKELIEKYRQDFPNAELPEHWPEGLSQNTTD